MREFIAGKNRWILSTTRRDGRPQMSLVSGGMTAAGELAVASYPSRIKVKNAKADPNVSVPSAPAHSPAATAAPAPPDDPPGVYPCLCGF